MDATRYQSMSATFLGMGGKYVAGKLSDIKTANNRLPFDMSKDQLKSVKSSRNIGHRHLGPANPQAARQ